MKIPRPLIAFLGTWAGVLLIYLGHVVHYEITTTEPDFKFGESAPYINLTVLGGFAGFVSSLAALLATLTFDRLGMQPTTRALLLACGLAAVPLALGAWYAAGYSPLLVSGTIVAWFAASFALFATLLYVLRSKSNA